MFLFSTLALSVLGTFACDGLDINSFVTWYDFQFLTPNRTPLCHHVFSFTLGKSVNVTKEEHILLTPILHFFLHLPNVPYLQS